MMKPRKKGTAYAGGKNFEADKKGVEVSVLEKGGQKPGVTTACHGEVWGEGG